MVVTTDRPRKRIVLNPMQAMLEIAPQRVRVAQFGRGSGKSTGAAIDIKNVTYDMPRSKNYIQTETFQQGLTLTLPSTVKALGMIGLKKDLNYFIGRRPPKPGGGRKRGKRQWNTSTPTYSTMGVTSNV